MLPAWGRPSVVPRISTLTESGGVNLSLACLHVTRCYAPEGGPSAAQEFDHNDLTTVKRVRAPRPVKNPPSPAYRKPYRHPDPSLTENRGRPAPVQARCRPRWKRSRARPRLGRAGIGGNGHDSRRELVSGAQIGPLGPAGCAAEGVRGVDSGSPVVTARAAGGAGWSFPGRRGGHRTTGGLHRIRARSRGFEDETEPPGALSPGRAKEGMLPKSRPPS
jgi:hypothetical protein